MVARPRVREKDWVAVPRWRLGCLTAAFFLALVATVVFGLLFWLMQPRPPIEAVNLIGSDVDGLIVVDLHRSSRRVGRFLEVVVRPISYEVQSRPEQMSEDLSQLLDVLTFRRAFCLLRFDPESAEEQWAWVIPLKRMSSPLKLLVEQFASGNTSGSVETEAIDGVLFFWGKNRSPCFAIAPRAVIVAGDRAWLEEMLERVERPLAKTPRANRLRLSLPPRGKHRILRACVLVSPGRWKRWSDASLEGRLFLGSIARLIRVIESCGLEAGDCEMAAASATVEPRGRLKVVVAVGCRETTATETLARAVRSRWDELSAVLRGPDVAALSAPTSGTAGVVFSWITPPIEQMLGLAPGEIPQPVRGGQ